MNKRMMTAWLIVIMVLIIIAIGFAAFSGISFYSGGNFTLAYTVALCLCFVLFFMFFLPQQLKAIDCDFNKMIWIERWMVLLLAPLTLLITMLPVAHFLNIQQQRGEIVSQFTCAIDTAKAMFAEYEDYAHDRISDYRHQLRFKKPLDQQNKVRGLELQLLSANYDTLHVSAFKWIEASINEPSTLDVFLLGNIDEIGHAINDWSQQLERFSEHRMSEENENTPVFSLGAKSSQASQQLLEDLRQRYRKTNLKQVITPSSLVALLIVWFFLMCPYWVQKRHTKSRQLLFGRKYIKENELMFYWRK